MTPEQKAELEQQRKALIEEQKRMDQALEAAQNAQPGETIIESNADNESNSDEDDDDNFEVQSQATDGSILSPGLGGKHPYLGSAISTDTGAALQNNFNNMKMKENTEIVEIDDDDIIQMPREQSDTFKSIVATSESPAKSAELEQQFQATPSKETESQSPQSQTLSVLASTPRVAGGLEMIEEEQSFDEKELQDNNGEFIIFAPDEENTNDAEHSITTKTEPESTTSTSKIDSKQADLSTTKDLEQPTLEAKFDKLNYTNKIQILLKALMIEREKNRENMIRLNVMKQQYIKKVQMVKDYKIEKDENEQLIEKVAQYEITIDEKNEEINRMTEKKNEFKNKM